MFVNLCRIKSWKLSSSNSEDMKKERELVCPEILEGALGLINGKGLAQNEMEQNRNDW